MTVEAMTERAPVLPALTRLMSFDEASERVLDYLRILIPMSFWSVTEHDVEGDRQVYLHLRDDTGEVTVGDSTPWSETFCQFMVTGAAPQLAADAMAVPQYAAVSASAGYQIGAYIGVPILSGDGELFGTLCASDPRRQNGGFLQQHAPLLGLLASLLGQILAGERLQLEAREREDTLRWRAFHDELTSLPNRALFYDRLRRALELYERDQHPVAVLTLDVDDFKAVNDTFGHGGGDELLVRLAQRLQAAVRAVDTLARMGGDEFAVLLEPAGGGGDVGVAERVADRIQAALAEPFIIGGHRLTVGLSVGVAAIERGARNVGADVLLTQADVALYAAKRGGKSQSTVYQPTMRLPEARDLQLREPLREAIENGDIQDVYQPVVALDTLTVVGVECLARWTHEGLPVSPSDFIPLAGRSRLLPALTTLMTDRACVQLRQWCRLGHDQLRVAVNVPPGLLKDRAFPAQVTAQVLRAGVQPHQLTLEITEDALVDDLDLAAVIAGDLHAAGFRLALDDFGTGYSSLLHLRTIPLDVVKIDRGFTSDVETNPRTRRFIQALLTMSQDLGLRVIVEGVERESQAEVLRDLGATHVQGYLYGRPAPAHQLDLSTLRPRSTP